MKHRIEQHRGVAARLHEAVSIRPDWIFRVEAQETLPQRIDQRRKVIGVPGWPDAARCTASIDKVRIVLIQRSSIEPSLGDVRTLCSVSIFMNGFCVVGSSFDQSAVA
jgi:hypothetical protein